MKNMTDEELVKIINKYEAVVIMGAGDAGEYLLRMLTEKCQDKTIAICDNSHKKQGKCLEINEVVSVERAVQLYPQALYLLTSSIHEMTMKTQLTALGISDRSILIGVTEGTCNYLEILKREIKFRPLEKLQFEVDITAHCNLNCKCCSQFSCIAEEEYIDVEKMEKDFRRLGELFEGEVNRIYLIGGEPLLHPQIIECMKIARKYFRTGNISVFTNGLLLLKQDDEFWKVCRNQGIDIIVTKYPISLDYNKIIEKARAEQVEFSFFSTSEDYKYMTNLGLDIEGKQDIFKSFIHCGEANNCIKLKDGRLFTCTRPAAVYKFNQFFGKNLEVVDEDFIDIYKAESKDEILRKLSSPIPFCRYCNVLGERRAMEWGQTSKNIEEWL